MGKYLRLLKCEKSEVSEKSPPPPTLISHNSLISHSDSPQSAPFGRICRFGRTLSALEARRPDHVPVARWDHAVKDGRAFLAKWGKQAEALGWNAADLFGLHKPPELPHLLYSRMSRYDGAGLIWLLEGRRVIALTETTATVANSSHRDCSTTAYRRPGEIERLCREFKLRKSRIENNG